MQGGAWFPDCRHAASTFNATGIATLATGAWPAQHGIVADTWYDRAAGRAVPASDEELMATTLAAQIAVEPRNRVYVISMEPAHAPLFAQSEDAALYWLDEQGAVATDDETPDWLANFNSQHDPANAHNAKWIAVGAKPDAAPLRILRYEAGHEGDFMAFYKSSPWAQDVQFDLLSELITRERLGQGSGLDFVCLIAGAMSRLGYETGGHSPLMNQMVLRLDHRIEMLLGQLSRAPGDGNFHFALAGAHGAPPLPSETSRARMTVEGETVAEAIDRALASHGLGRVQKYVYPNLYLNTEGFRDPEELRLAAARAAMELPAMAGFYTAGGACSTRDEWRRRFHNSFHPRNSGDVMLSYRPEYVEAYAQDRGVSYGSLYNYDVRVPLFLYGPSFRSGIYEGPVESVDVAPTLARIAGAAVPSSSVGRVLAEAILE